MSALVDHSRVTDAYQPPLDALLAGMTLPSRTAPWETQHGALAAARSTRLFSLDQRTRLRGQHPQRSRPVAEMTYVAGVATPGYGAAAAVIAELDSQELLPMLHIVHQVELHEEAAGATLPKALVTLAASWRLQRIVVGEGMPGTQSLGPVRASPVAIERLILGGPARAHLAMDLLRAIDAGRVQLYASGVSAPCRELWAEIVKAQCRIGPNGAFEIVAPSGAGGGHWLMALALAVEAARGLQTPSQGQLEDLLCA